MKQFTTERRSQLEGAVATINTLLADVAPAPKADPASTQSSGAAAAAPDVGAAVEAAVAKSLKPLEDKMAKALDGIQTQVDQQKAIISKQAKEISTLGNARPPPNGGGMQGGTTVAKSKQPVFTNRDLNEEND
jgi:hypothetical protein